MRLVKFAIYFCKFKKNSEQCKFVAYLALFELGGYTYQNSSVSQIYAAINTPTIHYYGGGTTGSNDYGWISSNPDSWTRANYPTPSTAKSIFDPCPYGYRVPTTNANSSGNSDFFGFTKPSTWNPATNMINGQTWLGSWWPTSGNRIRSSAAFGGVGYEGDYWSASPGSTSYSAYSLYFYSGYVNPANTNYRSYGFSLRCVQEERNITNTKKYYLCKMKIKFTKYHGAGNDFIIIDLLAQPEPQLTQTVVAALCDRYRGIGADGLMTLSADAQTDFRMRYWNADGNESTMCGNGGRCIAHFAHSIGLSKQNNLVFTAIDGIHTAQIIDNNTVKLKMIDAKIPEKIAQNVFFINTGSPHYIEFTENVETLNLPLIAPPIRQKYNCNVNFVEPKSGKIRTWERGVENETMACGTGATAAAITLNFTNLQPQNSIDIQTRFETLNVEFTKNNDLYQNVYLTGPAKKVFVGEIEILSIK